MARNTVREREIAIAAPLHTTHSARYHSASLIIRASENRAVPRALAYIYMCIDIILFLPRPSERLLISAERDRANMKAARWWAHAGCGLAERMSER